MRLMAFSMTVPQCVAMTKTHTRRTGWQNTRPGEFILQTTKGQGLKPGETVSPIRVIETVKVWREPIENITPKDVIREGFQRMSVDEFIVMFCKANKCTPDTEITVIEFGYTDLFWLHRESKVQWLKRWTLAPKPWWEEHGKTLTGSYYDEIQSRRARRKR